MSYDSRLDTLDHIREVRQNMAQLSEGLQERAIWHDASKLASPEKEAFDQHTPLLRSLTYGTPEYHEARAQLGRALEHHYASNSHHPEHYPDGISGMSLLDVVEMLADWAAAVKRHSDGDLQKSIDINAQRFQLEPQVVALLRNTAKEMGWLP